MSALSDQAVALAEAGIPVFPCLEDGKLPATEHGFKDASSDVEVVRAWWIENPNYNIAICPEDCGWIVVDEEADGAGEWDALCVENDPHEATYTVSTPRGGRHYYFTGSGRSSVKKIAPHVDTRGIGGYVLVPPSIVNGKPYEVVNDYEVQPIPEWLNPLLGLRVARSDVVSGEQAVASAASYDRAKNFLRTRVSLGEVAVEGSGGNNLTYNLVTKLIGLCPDGPALASLLKEIWNPHCLPPWSDEEIDTFVDNGLKYRQDAPGNYDDAGKPSETFKGFGQELLNTLPAGVVEPPKTPKKSRWAIWHEADMENQPEPTWIVKDLIPDDSVCLWVGGTQSFKSFLLLDVMLGVAAGVETFGCTPEPGIVIYGAPEDRAGVAGPRRKAWKSARGLQDTGIENFRVCLVPVIEMQEDIDAWIEEIAKDIGDQKLRMVAIDTAGKALGGENENDSSVVRRFWQICDAIRERFGCSVVAIHHSGKDADRGARGSSAWNADFDTVIETQRPSKDHFNVEVKVIKHKNAQDGKRWTLTGRNHAGSLVFEPITAREFEEVVEETTDRITPKKIGKALSSRKAFDVTKALSTPEVWMAMGRKLEDAESGCRELEKLSNTMLRAYCERDDKGVLQWYYAKREQT
jgi:AAA domain/Bifunctional DNA primase/polymerase, N-terminal